jgi:hypothetical protein
LTPAPHRIAAKHVDNVRFGSKADMTGRIRNVSYTPKADIANGSRDYVDANSIWRCYCNEQQMCRGGRLLAISPIRMVRASAPIIEIL